MSKDAILMNEQSRVVLVIIKLEHKSSKYVTRK